MQSINASGHKYGLVYPGVGWVIWRNPDALPDDLVFNVNYLGGDMPTFALNFSRPGQPGRRAVLQLPAPRLRGLPPGPAGVARRRHATLADEIAALGPFELLTDGSELPVFAFTLKDRTSTNYTVFDVSRAAARPRLAGPAYTFPENRQDLAALRIVVRNGFTATSPTCSSPTCSDTRPTSTSLTSPLPDGPGPSFAH